MSKKLTGKMSSVVGSRSLFLPSKKQTGFTLVELMIAGTLGLLLLAGIIQLFVGSQQSFTLQSQLADIQEDGRFALMVFERQVQKSSWNIDPSLSTPSAIDVANSSDGDNDSITFSYRGTIDGTNNLDCNSTPVADGLVINRFYVLDSDLMCQGNGGGPPQAIISNVEKFQLLYGVETQLSCPDGVVNRYMTQTDINGSAFSSNILSVRFAILLQSDDSLLPTAEARTYQMLDQSYTSANDRLVRRLFQQTIFMPNAVYLTVGSPQTVIDCMGSSI